MAQRPDGPEPPADRAERWTRADVERWLIIPMRQLRQTALFVGPGNVHTLVAEHSPSANLDILAFARTVLGKGTPELLAVTTWARITAAGGHAESSIGEWCRQMGWQTRSFHRRRIRGCERIAAAKNAADGSQ